MDNSCFLDEISESMSTDKEEDVARSELSIFRFREEREDKRDCRELSVFSRPSANFMVISSSGDRLRNEEDSEDWTVRIRIWKIIIFKFLRFEFHSIFYFMKNSIESPSMKCSVQMIYIN